MALSSTTQTNAVSPAQASIAGPVTTSLQISVQSLSSTVQTNAESPAQASIAGPVTTSLQVSVQSLSSTTQTNVDSPSQASISAPLTASLNVAIASLRSVVSTNAGSPSQASIGAPITASLVVSVQSLTTTVSTNVGSPSQASIGAPLTASLDVVIESLKSTVQTNADSPSQASIGAPKTASVDVSIQSPRSTVQTNIGSQSPGSIAPPLTSQLDIAISVLLLNSTAPTLVGGAGSQASIGQDLTSNLDVSLDTIRSTVQTNVESVSQASIANPATASLEVMVQSLTTNQQTNASSPSQASISAPVTASLNVSVQSLSSTVQTNASSPSQASIAAPLTASMDVSKDSLSSTISTSLESISQASISEPKTASIDVSVQSLTAANTTNLSSVSQASIAEPKTAALEISIQSLTTTVVTNIASNAQGSIADEMTAGVELLIANTQTINSNLDIPIRGTVAVLADIDAALASQQSVDCTLDILTQGTVTVGSVLQVLKQADISISAGLELNISSVLGVTASLNQLIQAIQFLYTDINVDVSPTRAFTIPLNTLVQGQSTRTANLSLAIQATEEKYTTLDMRIEVRRPYSLCKIWGHVRSRLFGGNTSDANFFEHFEPHPAAIANQSFGSISPGDRQITFQAPNTIPTISQFDKYSLPFSAPLATNIVGFRILACVTLRSFGPNNTLLMGGFTGTDSPVQDLANGNFIGLALEAERDHIELRAWAGGNESSRSFGLGLPVSRFLGVPLLFEIETVASTAGLARFEFRLFDRAFNLETPLAVIPLETSVPPTATHFAITSLGRRTPELPVTQGDMHVDLQYVDVEPGTGSVYTKEFLTPSDAKLRAFQDRPPLILSNDGPVLLADSLEADQGYWRASTEVATTLTFTGSAAQLTGVAYVEPTGSGAWLDYQVAVDFKASSASPGTNPLSVGLYASGDFLTGNALLFNVTYANQYELVRVVGGVPTSLASGSYTAETLDPTRWHRLRFNARTAADGTILAHAFIDDNPVYQGTTDSLAGGSVVLRNDTAVAVQFKDIEIRQGVNDVFMLLSDSPSSLAFTETAHDTMIVDSTDPTIVVLGFTTDSPVLVPNETNPPVVKGSPNPGFSGVALSWYATQPGTWTLRVNSTGATNGTEIRSGTYPEAFKTVSTGWDFSELPQVDGFYDVTLYVISSSGKPTAKRLGEYLLP